jgi:hypothetical protein
LKIKAFAGMLIKKANLKIVINQSLAVAIGFVAVIFPGRAVLRSAAKYLCISQAPQTRYRSKKCYEFSAK